MSTVQIPGPGWQLFVRGTIADLFLVPRADNDEPMVAKVLREDTPEGRRAIAREYRVLSAGVHPGLVSVLGGDPDGPHPYYLMPYLSGGTLTQYAGALDHELLRDLTRSLAEVFAALHARDIQHGDIKPDNVLITRRGTAKVSDPLGNGSGCTISWGTKWGGTPGYWAPEIAAGGAISNAGDVFSLGATIFHLATGIAPQDGQSLDPETCSVTLPKDLRRAILSMCDRDPKHRPSMEQVSLFLGGNQPSTPEATPTRPRAPQPQPTPTASSGAGWREALGLLFATVGTAALLNRSTKTWDPSAGRYRGSDGKFRGGGFFD